MYIKLWYHCKKDGGMGEPPVLNDFLGRNTLDRVQIGQSSPQNRVVKLHNQPL